MRDTAPIEPIAVVGLSFRLPGGANDVDGLWKLLASGESAWTPVPADWYNGEAFYHPEADDPNGTNNHPGGHFISGNLQDFDHAFFKFSKAQASATDPQQRLLMELAYEALESAGITRESIAGTPTSVYTACFPADYERQLNKDPLDLPVYYSTGTEKALLSNRLSHMLDLRGPSMTLDTACSGGLTALHQACQSLQSGESSTAIVAAVNLTLGPDHAIGLSNLHMISGTGRSYPFDDRGVGYGRGEGAVVLVLKRLDEALQDRDPVRAVVRGTAAGQDGYTPQTITYPSGRAQAALMRSAYARAGLRPEEVGYVEAHGTGTVAGDTEELSGIAEVFADRNATRSVPLHVGSMKGAIGHTESVSGLASLLKAVAMFDHNMIPPVAGFLNPKPGLPLDRISIPTKVIPWPQAPGLVPRISINSFGFGGSNAHAILERGPDAVPSAKDETSSPRLYTLSANSMTSLKAMIQAHLEWVSQREEGQLPLADLSYTLLHRRTALTHRFSAVAHDRASLLAELNQGLLAPASKSFPSQTDVFFVFTGQGAQWAGMGRELLLETTTPSSVFRNSIRASRDALRSLGATWDLETELLRPGSESRLQEAEIAQPATTAIQIALVALLRAQGVQPRAVVGHSSGEIAAAYTAGYLSHETAIKIAYHRGFMAAAVRAKGLGRGAMLSVGLGEQGVARYLDGLTKGKATVACVNSPRSVTISGDADAVDEVAERIAGSDEDIFHRKLLVDTAYHSHHMSAVAEEYRRRLSRVEQNEEGVADEIDFISSVTGLPQTSGFDLEYWVSNLVSPVRFSDAIQTLQQRHHRPDNQAFFVEIGPHPALSGPVRQTLQEQPQQPQAMPRVSIEYHAPLQRKKGAVASTLTLVGKLFENGIQIHWNAVSALAPGADTASVRHDLPAYVWDHSTKHWHESRVARAYLHRREPYHDLLGVPVPDATDLEPRWRHFVSLATLPWLADHVVDGLIVFPGSGYLCMAIESVMQLVRQSGAPQSLETLSFRNVSFKRALVLSETQRAELQLSLRPQSGAELCFGFAITALSDDGTWYEHATGVVQGLWAEDGARPEIISPEEALKGPVGGETILQNDIYSHLSAVGNTYGPMFAGLSSMTMATDASQALSSLKIPDVKTTMPAKYQRPHVIHPSTLDIIFHTTLPLAGRRLGPGSIMPVYIEELLISVTPQLEKPGSSLSVSTVLTSSHYHTALSDVTATAAGHRVLYATGIEVRSLSSRQGRADLASASDEREICYELGWHTDIDHMQAQDMPADSSLSDVIAQISLKRHGLSIIGLGASVDLSEEVLNAVRRNDDNEVTIFDFVDVTPGRFEDAAARVGEFNVQYHMLRPGMSPESRGFENASYDVVLATSAKWLQQAAVLAKPGGNILLVLSAHESMSNGWRTTLQNTSVALEEQVAFHTSDNRLVAVLKVHEASTKPPPTVHLLTHSSRGTSPAWVSSVYKGLRSRNFGVSLDMLNHDTVEALCSSKEAVSGNDDNRVFVILDDHSSPILSNPITFVAATTLLTRPAQVVWLSPDDPPAFHQVEGVARTAHAENENLHLITIHAASGLLADATSQGRLVDVVASTVSRLANPNIAHTEREYRIKSDGLVVVPRLHRSDRLNQAISDGNESSMSKTESHRFIDNQRPLMLSPDGSGVFIDDDSIYSTPLADDDIEVEAHDVVLSKSYVTEKSPRLGGYAGIVARVGANVTSLVPGQGVVAVAPTVGASRLCISHTQASPLPSETPSTAAAALLLDTMAASYALRSVARVLSSTGTILVQGARTAAGRAAVAVARSIGVRVTATATDAAEVRLLKEEIDIDAADVLVTRRSLFRSLPRDVFPNGLDAIIHAGEGPLLTEAVGFVKSFGSVVVTGHLSSVEGALKLPPNVALHFIDVAGLMQARPDLAASLVAEATALLKHIPLSGLDIPARDITDTMSALRLVNTGVQEKVVLQAGPHSNVQVLSSSKADRWADGDATYVISGGLGDMGLRLLCQLAERGAKHIATISRRTLDPESHRGLREKLEAIQTGIHLYTLQGDVSSEASMQSAVATLARRGAPPVRGIIQAAMLLMERPLELITHEDFTSITKPKVQGAQILYDAFKSSSLNFVLSLSSFAGINGAGALAAYNAGNTVQDALAHRETAEESTRFLTVDFGWTDDVQYTANDDKRQGALRRAGFTLIRAEELARFFDYVLDAVVDDSPSARQLRQAVIGVDAASLAGATALNSNVYSAMFTHIRSARHRAREADAAAAAGVEGEDPRTFEQVVAEGDGDAVVDFVSRALVAQLARLIDVDAAGVDVHHGSVLNLGLDSLVAVELRTWVMKQFRAPLQSLEILVDQTVWELAQRVVARSTGISASSSSRAPPKATAAASIEAASHRSPEEPLPDTAPFASHGFLDPKSVLDAFHHVKSATDNYISTSKLCTYSAEWMPKSDEISIAIFCNALEELGCPIRSAAPEVRLERIAHSPSHEKLVGHIYKQLEKKHLIRVDGSGFVRTDNPCPSDDIDTPLNELLRDRPEQEAEIKLMRIMGSNYGQCLAGKVDAVQLLFGDPEARDLLARSYSTSELNSVLIKQLTDFVEAAARSWQENSEPLRVLEVGAGTGGTTSWLLPVLARLNIPVIYTFTDIGRVFVKEASLKFKEFPFVECRVLDIEQETDPQLRHSQHLVLGTNVIHATRDVSQTLRNIHGLLRPDGFVAIVEMTTNMLWTDVIFGPLAGFWCFEDGRHHATQDAEAWRRAFTSAGYGHVDWTQGERPEAALQALLFAMASKP